MSKLLGGKTLFTFETRKELFKFRWQWSLTLAIVLSARILFDMHILMTLSIAMLQFIGFFSASYLALTKEVVTIENETSTNKPRENRTIKT